LEKEISREEIGNQQDIKNDNDEKFPDYGKASQMSLDM